MSGVLKLFSSPRKNKIILIPAFAGLTGLPAVARFGGRRPFFAKDTQGKTGCSIMAVHKAGGLVARVRFSAPRPKNTPGVDVLPGSAATLYLGGRLWLGGGTTSHLLRNCLLRFLLSLKRDAYGSRFFTNLLYWFVEASLPLPFVACNRALAESTRLSAGVAHWS